MDGQLRRLRGVMGLGVIWGIVWAVIFAALVTVIGTVDPTIVDAGEGPMDVSPIGGIAGLVGGVAFGVLLSLAERGTSVMNISLTRAAMWGALGAAVFPLLAGKPDQVLVFAPIGVLVALASVALAKRGAGRSTSKLTRGPGVVAGCVLALVGDVIGSNRTKVA